MKFKVIASERALKDLKKLSKIEKKRIYEELEKLEDPFKLDIKKLRKNIYRVRVGRFRIIIEIDFNSQLVWVAKIDKRERVYAAYNSLSSRNSIDLMK